MMNKVINFKIVPVFNQALPKAWDDFIRIEYVCDKEIYNLDTSEKVKQWRLQNYKDDFYHKKHSFAFGAYYKNRMIGFTHGQLEGTNEIYLERLYVLPKYQRFGIGTNLLKAVESAAGIMSEKITLSPLKEAVDFYERKNGYTHFMCMEKKLTPMSNVVVPVFQWVKKDFIVKFDIPVNTMFLKQNKYQPIFVHINGDCKIDGVAVQTVKGENMVWARDNKLKLVLLETLNKIK